MQGYAYPSPHLKWREMFYDAAAQRFDTQDFFLKHPALLRAGNFDFHAAIRLQAGDQCLGCFRAFAFTWLRHGI